jgi:hypothetical protein
MESIIFRVFEVTFKAVGILLLTGALASALTDIQKRAFEGKRTGLTSMLKINEQLVGKSR